MSHVVRFVGASSALWVIQDLTQCTGRRCWPVVADVRNPEAVDRAIDEALEAAGKIDILINGAAGNFLCQLDKLSYNGFKSVMEIDAHGTFIVSQAVFRKCFKETGNGLILNISMTLHYTGTLAQGHAGAAKAAIDALTKHMAVEWGPYGVRVNGIAPGPIADTEGMRRLYTGNKESSHGGKTTNAMDMMTTLIPLQRLGTSRDIGNAAAFLAMEEASFITGATLVVDGGQWLTVGNFTALDPANIRRWNTIGKERLQKRAEVSKL
eukprot:GHVT01049147.1.p1 GENE.GHVT01049147.1~~GHVT01049147.1.p1  ORF type:complete len:266 (-),score=9.81 GHVT01049147.1:453-1250(-)